MATDTAHPQRRFRSRDWFDDPTRIDQSAIYLERFMNYGVTPEELRSGKPIIGIAQPGSPRRNARNRSMPRACCIWSRPRQPRRWTLRLL